MGFWKYDHQTWLEALTELWEVLRKVGLVKALYAVLILIPLAVAEKVCFRLSDGFETLARWLGQQIDG